EAAENDDPPVGCVGEAVLVAIPFAADGIGEREGHEKIERLAGREVREVRVGDADNRGSSAIEANGLADGGWSRTEGADPIGIIQNDDWGRGGRIVGERERATDESVDAESREKI